MTTILGISAYYHDSAAALIVDGEIIAAAQEERFTRKKSDDGFPQHAVDYCLSQGGVTPKDLDFVGFYEKPLRKFQRLLETYLTFSPAGYRSFRRALPTWLKQKLHLPREMSRSLPGYKGRYVFTEHHESHAASAFFPSPFDEAAILTMDGVGEWATTCLGVGRGNQIELTDEICFPHSLGLLYSAVTYYTGFRVNRGEYKVMGLAPYGRPIYTDQLLEHIVTVRDDGSFRLDMDYFNYCQGLTMTNRRFHDLFGGPPRRPDSHITQREMDLAASVQKVAEKIILRTCNYLHDKTGCSNLVLAGGVALNSVANGRILREGPFDNLWIQPAAGDAGGALGNAQFIWHQLLENPRQFAVTSLIVLPLAGWMWDGNRQIIAWLAMIGLLLTAVSWFWPHVIKPVFIALTLLTLPIGKVVSEIVLMTVYFGVFCPTGIWFRISGRDPLQLKSHKLQTFWRTRKQARSATSYYRQS